MTPAIEVHLPCDRDEMEILVHWNDAQHMRYRMSMRRLRDTHPYMMRNAIFQEIRTMVLASDAGWWLWRVLADELHFFLGSGGFRSR